MPRTLPNMVARPTPAIETASANKIKNRIRLISPPGAESKTPPPRARDGTPGQVTPRAHQSRGTRMRHANYWDLKFAVNWRALWVAGQEGWDQRRGPIRNHC